MAVDMSTPENHVLSSLKANANRVDKLQPLFCIQGGGAKGGWQGGVLSTLLISRRISPIGAFGTSAGALNSWFISKQLNEPTVDVFTLFWSRLPYLTWVVLVPLISVVCMVLNIIPCITISFMCIYFLGTFLFSGRFPGLIPFQIFSYMIKFIIGSHPSKLHLYFFATDIDNEFPPEVYDSQNLATFEIKPNSNKADFYHDTLSISAHDAIAASCALPILVNPLSLGGRHYLDGGLYSNLPINVALSQGSLGGHCIICLVPKPISALTPSSDIIDYRTVKLLHDLQELQQTWQNTIHNTINNSHSNSRGISVTTVTYPSYTFLPIFVICPEENLKSNTWTGFFCSKIMSADITAGKNAGNSFVQSFEMLMGGNPSKISKYLLQNMDIPELKRPPKYKRWRYWVNRKWTNAGVL